MCQAVILAGGLGTRLGTLTKNIPKSLIEVNNRPFLFYQFDLLMANGISEVVMLVGHLGEQIEKAVNQSNYGKRLRVTFCYDGDQLLGTAGSIRNALDKLKSHFFVFYGDSYLDIPYQDVYGQFVRKDKPALMTILKNEDKWDLSNVEFDGEDIVAYSKTNRTDRMNYIDYGLSVFDRNVFEEYVSANHNHDLAELMIFLLKENQVAAFEVHKRFYEVGSVSGLEEFRHLIDK